MVEIFVSNCILLSSEILTTDCYHEIISSKSQACILAFGLNDDCTMESLFGSIGYLTGEH